MLNFTDENFNKEILSSSKPVLVDFWMQGCTPCLLLSPILEKLEKEFSPKIIFAKANLDEIPLTIQKYGINVAPTVILFSQGELISGFIGLRPEAEIKTWLEEILSIQEYQEYAEKNGLSLNPDKKVVEAIVKSLLEREKKFGARYCPCRKITGNQEEDKKIICPCFYHLQEIQEKGRCLCGLFVRKIVK